MKRMLSLLLLLVLAACNGSSVGDPADVVERYLTAKVAGDGDALRPLLCSELESTFSREVSSFATVEGARLENMECSRQGDGEIVACTGEIVATYGTETNRFPLASYRVVQEDGEWKWCGESD
jgi:hypothetical protein